MLDEEQRARLEEVLAGLTDTTPAEQRGAGELLGGGRLLAAHRRRLPSRGQPSQ